MKTITRILLLAFAILASIPLTSSADDAKLASSSIRVVLPDGWGETPVSDADKRRGTFYSAAYKHNGDEGKRLLLLINSIKKSEISDMDKLVRNQLENFKSMFYDPQFGEIKHQPVSRYDAWQFDISGMKSFGSSKAPVSIFFTYLYGKDEVIVFKFVSPNKSIHDRKGEMMGIIESVTGFDEPDSLQISEDGKNANASNYQDKNAAEISESETAHKLRELHSLRREGLITEHEFQEKKEKLLKQY